MAGLAVDGLAAGQVTDKLGDVAYGVLIVFGVWLLRPDAPVRGLVAIGLTWCLAVELLQLTALPGAVTAEVPLARLVLGSGFDALDLVAYAAGCVSAWGVVSAVRRGERHRA